MAGRPGRSDGGAARAVGAGVIAGLRQQIAGAGFAAGWGMLNNIPAPIAARCFRAAADAATARGGPAVRQLRRNLRRVAGPARTEPEMDALVAAAMRSYARYWLETFRLPKMNRTAVAARAGRQTFGTEHLDAAVAAGRGFILALPHTGNYDVAGLWLIERYGKPFTTVAERLNPASLFDRFVAYRQSIGMEVLALTGGEQPPTAILTERLKAGGGVCLVADRDLSQHGVEVDFFGERARLPSGPALLAATTGAALLPVGLWFTPDGGWGQQIMAPVERPPGRLRDQVHTGTQRLADAFAQLISEHPSDWHMLQKLWLADRPAPTAGTGR
jgi:lauroyl/myristoyl acyltransferase